MPPLNTTKTPRKTTGPQPEASPTSPTVSAAIPSYARTTEQPAPTDTTTATATATPAEQPGITSPPETPPAGGADSAAGTPDGPAATPGSPTRRRGRWLRLMAGKVDPEARALVLQGATAALAGIGQLLHLQFANPRRFGANDVWLPDSDDQQYIAGPVASIIARRMPDGVGEDSDVGDLITAAIATGGYAIKNVQARGKLVRLSKTGGWSDAERADSAPASPGPDFAAGVGGAR